MATHIYMNIVLFISFSSIVLVDQRCYDVFIYKLLFCNFILCVILKIKRLKVLLWKSLVCMELGSRKEILSPLFLSFTLFLFPFSPDSILQM